MISGQLVPLGLGQPIRTGTGVDVGLPQPVSQRGLDQIEVLREIGLFTAPELALYDATSSAPVVPNETTLPG